MKIKGSVTSREHFLEVLRDLVESKTSGILVVVDGDVERQLYLEDGEIAAATSTAPGESFGEFLIEKALIQEHVLESAKQLRRDPPALLGKKLVELGVMTEEEVQRALQLKIEKTISDICSCPKGKLNFLGGRLRDGERVPALFDTGRLFPGGVTKFDKKPPPKREPAKLGPPLGLFVKASPKAPLPISASSETPTSLPDSVGPLPRGQESLAPKTPQLFPTLSPEPKSRTPKKQDRRSAELRKVFKELKGELVGEPQKEFEEKFKEEPEEEPEEELKEEYPSPLAGSREPVSSSPAIRQAGSDWAAPRPGRQTVVVAAGIAIGSLVLLSAGYWYFYKTSSSDVARVREAQDDFSSGSEVPQIGTSAYDAGGEPIPREGKPPSGLESKASTSGSRNPPSPEFQAVAPSSDSTGSAISNTPDVPSRPASQVRPVEEPSTPSAHPPVERASGPIDSKVDRDQPEPPLQPPVVAPELSAEPGPGVAEDPGEVTSEPSEPSGWETAVFAPKSAVVRVESPSQPSVQRGELVEPGSDVIDPVLLEHPELKYPGDAKRQKKEAVVRVRVLVDENGKVLEAKLDEPVGYGFDEAAIKVALKATFIPATKGTVQVKMWTVLPLAYRLEKK